MPLPTKDAALPLDETPKPVLSVAATRKRATSQIVGNLHKPCGALLIMLSVGGVVDVFVRGGPPPSPGLAAAAASSIIHTSPLLAEFYAVREGFHAVSRGLATMSATTVKVTTKVKALAETVQKLTEQLHLLDPSTATDQARAEVAQGPVRTDPDPPSFDETEVSSSQGRRGPPQPPSAPAAVSDPVRTDPGPPSFDETEGSSSQGRRGPPKPPSAPSAIVDPVRTHPGPRRRGPPSAVVLPSTGISAWTDIPSSTPTPSEDLVDQLFPSSQ